MGNWGLVVPAIACALAIVAAAAAQPPGQLGYDDTPMQPNGRWHIHDGKRPQPKIVTPGVKNVEPIPPPSDATVLIGAGDDLAAW